MRCILSFVLLMLGVSTVAVAAPPGFTSIDVPGASNTIAWGINAHGDIVGQYFDTSGGHGFLLSSGVFTTIDVPGASFTGARGINSHGDIVGFYRNPGSAINHGFLLSGGVFTPIDVLGADTVAACGQRAGTGAGGINLLGDIVGVYSKGGDIHGYLLSGGAFTTIDVLGGTCTHPLGISTAGEIVGWFLGGDGTYHGFSLIGGTFTTFDVPGNSAAAAFGIDPSSTFIVGLDGPDKAAVDLQTSEHGFLLSGGAFTTIDFPGASVTEAFGVNPQGDVVGDYLDSGGAAHGFLFGKQKQKKK